MSGTFPCNRQSIVLSFFLLKYIAPLIRFTLNLSFFNSQHKILKTFTFFFRIFKKFSVPMGWVEWKKFRHSLVLSQSRYFEVFNSQHNILKTFTFFFRIFKKFSVPRGWIIWKNFRHSLVLSQRGYFEGCTFW